MPPPGQWTGNPPAIPPATSGSNATTFSTTLASFSLASLAPGRSRGDHSRAQALLDAAAKLI